MSARTLLWTSKTHPPHTSLLSTTAALSPSSSTLSRANRTPRLSLACSASANKHARTKQRLLRAKTAEECKEEEERCAARRRERWCRSRLRKSGGDRLLESAAATGGLGFGVLGFRRLPLPESLELLRLLLRGAEGTLVPNTVVTSCKSSNGLATTILDEGSAAVG